MPGRHFNQGCVLVFLSGCLLAQSNLFNYGGSFHTGGGPGTRQTPWGSAAATGDLNGDGKQDLVVANYSTDNVTILLGDGTGGFTEPPDSPVAAGRSPTSVAIGDFNGDGTPDLAITNYLNMVPSSDPDRVELAGTVTLLLGSGAGSFTAAPKSPFRGGGGLITGAKGDFNGDGNQDIAALFCGGVWFLWGDGLGGFAPQTTIVSALGCRASSMAFGDFNGDGKVDFVIGDTSTGDRGPVFLGNGTGAFTQSGQLLLVGPLPGIRLQFVAAGDFNGDGRADVVAVDPDSDSMLRWSGNTSGVFDSQPAFSRLPLKSGAVFVAVADFNGDGKLDLATANRTTSNVGVLLGDGAGEFTAAPGSPFAVGNLPGAIAVADFNGDGKPDLATVNNNDVTILLNSAQPLVRLLTKSSASFASSAVFAPDMIAFGEAPDIAPALVVAPDGPWPTTLGGVRLEITDNQGQIHLAPVYFVTTTALSYLIPAGVASGRADLKLTTSTGVTIPGTLDIGPVSPGLYTANASGSDVAAGLWIRVAANGQQSQGYLFDPAKPVGSRDPVFVDLGPPGDQLFLSLYGTGFRNAATATAMVGGISVPVYGFAAVEAYQGEDVINIGPLPRLFLGYANPVQVAITFAGKPANTVTVAIH